MNSHKGGGWRLHTLLAGVSKGINYYKAEGTPTTTVHWCVQPSAFTLEHVQVSVMKMYVQRSQ